MTDEEWLSEVRKITGLREMLKCLLENRDICGGSDPYYARLNMVVWDQVEKVLKNK